MAAHLTKTCGCGRSAGIECPSVADIIPALEHFAGWGYDDHGLVTCPQCIAAGTVSMPLLASIQPDLFGEAA